MENLLASLRMYRCLPTITAKQRTVRYKCTLKQTTLKQRRMVEKKVISVPFAAFFCYKETLLRKMHGKPDNKEAFPTSFSIDWFRILLS